MNNLFKILIGIVVVLLIVALVAVIKFGLGYFIGWVIMKVFNVNLKCCYLPVVTGIAAVIIGMFAWDRK